MTESSIFNNDGKYTISFLLENFIRNLPEYSSLKKTSFTREKARK
jgi:hypothetical protein